LPGTAFLPLAAEASIARACVQPPVMLGVTLERDPGGLAAMHQRGGDGHAPLMPIRMANPLTHQRIL
jgi:hypothetical protein